MKDIEESRNANESRKLYRLVNSDWRAFKPRITMCKDAEGNIMTSKAQILERWVAHFDALLNRNFNNRLSNTHTEENNEDFKPTKDEIESVTDKLKNNKAPGIDNIQAELLKHGSQNLILFLQKSLDLVWIMEIMSDE
jgi:hypothetical protein